MQMKKKYIYITLPTLLSIGGGTWFYQQYRSFTPDYKDDIILEYGDTNIDVHDLLTYTAKNEDIILKDVQSYDPLNEETQQIEVALQRNQRTITETVPVEVKDTKEPVIELVQDHVDIETGENFHVDDNIVSVQDPVDGRIEDIRHGTLIEYRMFLRNRMRKMNCVFIGSDMDVQTPGDYEVHIVSYDRASNCAMRTYTVYVKQQSTRSRMVEPASEEEMEPRSTALWQKDVPQAITATKDAVYDPMMPPEWIPFYALYDDSEHVFASYSDAWEAYRNRPSAEQGHWQIQTIEGIQDNQGKRVTCFILVDTTKNTVIPLETATDREHHSTDEITAIP